LMTNWQVSSDPRTNRQVSSDPRESSGGKVRKLATSPCVDDACLQ
jgi:hypothetical protein